MMLWMVSLEASLNSFSVFLSSSIKIAPPTKPYTTMKTKVSRNDKKFAIVTKQVPIDSALKESNQTF